MSGHLSEVHKQGWKAAPAKLSQSITSSTVHSLDCWCWFWRCWSRWCDTYVSPSSSLHYILSFATNI